MVSTCPSFYCYDKTLRKNNVEKKMLSFILELLGHSASLKKVKVGTQYRNLWAGTEVETRKECCTLACFLWPWLAFCDFGLLSVSFLACFLISGSTAHSGLDPPKLITNQENVPTEKLIDQFDWDSLSIEVPSSLMILSHVTLTETDVCSA